jgi:hypothetical protein
MQLHLGMLLIGCWLNRNNRIKEKEKQKEERRYLAMTRKILFLEPNK